MGVGAFPGIMNPNKRTVRAPSNPMDKSTICSIYPKRIEETKHTIQPGFFTIEPGTYDKPSLLVVGPSSWWKELDDNQPLLEIPTSSIQIADSVVRDYCNGLLGCDMANVMPGLFFLPGDLSVEDIKKKHMSYLLRAKANQDRWFRELVKLADSLWSRSNGNPLAISDDMRMAAKDLNLNSKEWLQDFNSVEMIKCVGCGSMRNPLFPICPSCHNVIDTELYNKLGIKNQENK